MKSNLRDEAIDKLTKTFNYPGRFPVLVIGDTGTGKTYSIQNAISVATKVKGAYETVNAGLSEETVDFWDNILKKSDNKFLIIDDVEKLSKKSQEILFDRMSTENGLYGFGEKNLTIRIVFVSTFPISKIRDDRRYLTARFFDRISQFVVEFPNFEKTQTNIYDDFISTWDKMFKNNVRYKEEYPDFPEFKKWLEGIAYKMYGNFRDLDKIVINWNLHQISFNYDGKDENKDEINNKILDIIKTDFEKYLHNPSQRIAEDNTFVLDEDSDYGTLINDFRHKVKEWSMAINDNNIKKAAKMLKMNPRTMEGWDRKKQIAKK
ncbi:MAG: ATP-binding protein [Bacteroidales bacterium]